MRSSRVLNIALLVAGIAYGIYQWQQTPRDSGEAASVGAPGPTPPDLRQFMARAITVYRSQDFSEIVKLMPPVEIQALQPRGKNLSLGELATVLRERPAAQATAALNLQEVLAVQDKTPFLEEEGTRAIYALDPPIQGQTQVVFVKIGETWYKP